ncbi:LOW QUALITY PROTEIN: hypothetical protein BSKO_11242 [Bryopsis sp. KO-2023]|nr:LOW QUALITY PROTEIN: hypothetical protein BSKO_11242 [Bryopsis sp. KO-2023]
MIVSDSSIPYDQTGWHCSISLLFLDSDSPANFESAVPPPSRARFIENKHRGLSRRRGHCVVGSTMGGCVGSRRQAVFVVILWICCAVTRVPAIPLLFPAVDEFTSLVYDEATEALLPIQAAFPFFLCSAAGETVDLDLATEACGGKVIYTKSNTFSLTLLSLSDLGLLQPIPDPDVEVDTSAKVKVSEFGIGGLIPGAEVLSVVTDVASLPIPGGRKLLQLPTPGDTTSPIGGVPETVAVPTIGDVGEAAGAAGEAVQDSVTAPAVDAVPDVAPDVSGVADAVGETVQNTTEAVTPDVSEVAGSVGETVQNTTKAVADSTAPLTDAVNQTATDLAETGAGAVETGAGAVEQGAELVEGTTEQAVSTGLNLTSGAIEAGSEAATALIETGQGFVETAQGLVLDLAEFNLTESLRNPDQIPSGLSFLLQVDVTDLPANEATKVKVNSGGSVREVYIFYDESPPEPSLSPSKNQTKVPSDAKEAEVKFEISFTERILPLVAPDILECNPLQSTFGDLLSPEALTNPNTILDLLDATSIAADLVDAAGECGVDPTSGGLLNFDPSELFTIGGALESKSDYILPQFNVADLGKNLAGSKDAPKVVITAKFDPNDTSTVIDLGTAAGTIMDYAALLNLDGSLFSFGWAEMMEWLRAGQILAEDIIQRGKNLGTAATTVVASTIAGSVATSVGVTVAGSIGGSVAGSGASAAGGTMNGAVDLLNVGQKVFLTGNLAVGNMPENYKAFAEQLKWTMFDIKLPWDDDEKETGPQVSQGRRKLKMLSLAEDQAAEFVGASDSEDPRDLVKRSFFWIALFFAVLLVIHLSIAAVLMLRRIKVPPILRFPRLELYFMYWAIPAIATSSAGLFKGDTSDKVLGAFLVALFPFAFIVWHLYVLRKHFYSRSVESCKAALVYETLDAEQAEKEGVEGAEKEEVEEKPATGFMGFFKRCCAKLDEWMERLVYTPFLGAPYDEGTWVAPTGPKSMFFNRYGAMFQDFRHRPSTRSNVTYTYDESKGGFNRGEVRAVEVRQGLENTEIGHVIQISGKLLEVAKLVFVAMIISGEDDPSSNAQAIVLLVLTVLYAVLLRVFRPPLARWDLGMAMVGEVGDILTYIFAIMIINNGDSDQPGFMQSMGIALLCFQGLAFLATFLDNLFVLVDAGKAAYEACKNGNQEPPKMLDVVLKAQLNNTRYLERKYYNRWLTRTLGKGVHTGSVKQAPLEEVVFGYTQKSSGLLSKTNRAKGGASGKMKEQKKDDEKKGGKE